MYIVKKVTEDDLKCLLAQSVKAVLTPCRKECMFPCDAPPTNLIYTMKNQLCGGLTLRQVEADIFYIQHFFLLPGLPPCSVSALFRGILEYIKTIHPGQCTLCFKKGLFVGI